MKKSQKREKVYRLGELFCGPGGLALGALNAKATTSDSIYKIKHAWANDYDKDACQTYANNICNGNHSTVYCEDVRQLNLETLGKIEAFAFGFPCNDFSLVGERKGFNGNFGPLYKYGIKVINHYKPKFFIAENVKGLSNANEGFAFEKILDDLKKCGNGYNITAHLYKFEQYGIPQYRHRIIIVGIDSTLNYKFKVPAPISSHTHKTCREAIMIPPIPNDAPNHETTKQSTTVIERLKYIKPGENAWTANLPNSLQLNVKGAKLSQIYRRMDPNKPAYTITGSGGGGTHGYHWKENRALTNRERARIQTFPDKYIFSGKKESVRKQIGMAVPPLGAKIIVESILKTLADIDYKCIPESYTTR